MVRNLNFVFHIHWQHIKIFGSLVKTPTVGSFSRNTMYKPLSIFRDKEHKHIIFIIFKICTI